MKFEIGNRVTYIYNRGYEGNGALLGAKGLVVDCDGRVVKCIWTPKNVRFNTFRWWVPIGWVRLQRTEESS